MNTYKIWIMGMLLVFIVEPLVFVVEVWGSVDNLWAGGPVYLSFIAMLVAIAALFIAYICSADLLTKRLKASKRTE